MPCPHCQTPETRHRQRLTKQGLSTFFCPQCRRTFNPRTNTPFNDRHYPEDIIFLVVFWRLRYKLSLRDIPEMPCTWGAAQVFAVRGFRFTHETVREWEERFAPLITAKLKAKRANQFSEKWRVDETYVKINGKEHYLYRAVDGLGNLIDVRLSATRDMAAAKAFFQQARQTIKNTPKVVITDKHGAYPRAIRTILGKRVEHRQSKYLNNRLEQDHLAPTHSVGVGRIKQRYKPMGGFKTFASAARFCTAFDEQRNYFRYRQYANEPVSLRQQRILFWKNFTWRRIEVTTTPCA